MKRIYYFIITLMIIACFACSSDSQETKNKDTKIDNGSLAGTWDAVEMSYTSAKNPNKSMDMMKKYQASLTMTIKANGTYTYSAKMMGMTTNQSGAIKKNGNKITTDNPDFKMTLSGNVLTMRVENQSWDFGSGREPAVSKAVFKRK